MNRSNSKIVKSYRSQRPGVSSVTKGLLQPARRLSGYKVDEQITWFLDELYTCCNRKDEGRELEFGFVLGQPRMVRYWPGSQDVYLPEMTFDALMDSTYLLEPPEERVVTVPYASTRKARGVGTQGIEIMDVGAIPEQLHGGGHRGIWDGSLRPLAHLTAHYPWAVGVGVGPGSKMRVFSGGELRFIRDERGWKEYGAKLTEGDALALTAWPDAPPDYRNGVKELLCFALQFSSNVRRNSHGALILWLPEPSKDDLDDCECHTSTLMREELKEERGGMPSRPSGFGAW